MTISTALLNLLFSVLSVAAGGYILLFGRRQLWASLGVIGLLVTATVLAKFVVGAEEARDLVTMREWLYIGISLLVCLAGVSLGRARPALAGQVLGFLAGAEIALWFFGIARYLTTLVGELPEQTAMIVGISLAILVGLGGLWLVRKSRDEALIIITMLIGVELVLRGLRLDRDSSLTAVILLSLGLFSLVVQYADYLRELKADTPLSQYVADRAQRGSGEQSPTT